jgi:hypothetical protein
MDLRYDIFSLVEPLSRSVTLDTRRKQNDGIDKNAIVQELTDANDKLCKCQANSIMVEEFSSQLALM